MAGQGNFWILSTAVVVVLVICHRGEALRFERGFEVRYDAHQPLSQVALHNARVLLDKSVSISASPELLGQKVIIYLSLRKDLQFRSQSI